MTTSSGQPAVPLAAVALLATFLLTAGCGKTEAKPEAKQAERVAPIAVSLVAPEERRLPSSLEVTGTLMPDAQTEIPAEPEQRVVEVSVERGQLVAAGQVIARLDAQDATNQLREAEATEGQIRERLGLADGQAFDPLKTPEVQQARATMDRAEADYRRFVQLLDEGAVSRADHDLRRADYLATKAQHETTVNQMRQIYQSLLTQKVRVTIGKKAVEDTVVRAPYAGLIAERHVSVGRFMKKGDRIATLVRIDPLRIELNIPEGAVATVRSGQKVSFAVQTYPDRRFEGTIAYIGPSVKADSRALVVEAIVPNPKGVLRPGLFATASIELPAQQPSLMVPASALRSEGGVTRLFVVRGDRAEVRIVQLGRETGGLVEVLRGLDPKDRLVGRPPEALRDGALVAAQEAR
jgi:RND family efflux transporter MFP subunit